MAGSGDIGLTVTDTQVINALKRCDEESFKAIKKRFTDLATDGKRAVVANTPVKTGFAKSHWSKQSGWTKKNSFKAQVTIKGWPKGEARYPFILEHGRKAGVSAKTGREVTAMSPRPIISPVRARFQSRGQKALEQATKDALAAFDR